MEELVKNPKIVDAELVKAVGSILHGESLERILDEARSILLQRALIAVKTKQFLTVIHLVEHLKTARLTPSDIVYVLRNLESDIEVREDLRTDIKKLLDSGLFNSVFKFVCEIEALDERPNQKHTCCFRCRD